MTVVERCCTAFVLILGLFMTLVFLPARVEADPMEAKMMMNRIGFYQFGFVVQAMPGLLCVLFHPTIRPIPILLGLICGLTILPALSTAIFEKKFYGTDVPEGQPNYVQAHGEHHRNRLQQDGLGCLLYAGDVDLYALS